MTSFIPFHNTAWKLPTSPSILICRKLLCVNSKCNIHIFSININKGTTHEEPNWIISTSPATLHKISCCQAIFTANSVVPGCEIDLKIYFFLTGRLQQKMQRYSERIESFAGSGGLSHEYSEISLSLAPIWLSTLITFLTKQCLCLTERPTFYLKNLLNLV